MNRHMASDCFQGLPAYFTEHAIGEHLDQRQASFTQTPYFSFRKLQPARRTAKLDSGRTSSLLL
jgi:hypothetical protein